MHVNLIPYNTTEVGAQFQSPSPEDIRAFHAILREAYNLKATIRENHGTDIDGACGQLALKNKSDGSTLQRDMEDFGRRRTKSSRKNAKALSASDSKSGDVSSRFLALWLTRANDFIGEHQQAIGFALLAASVAVLATGIARQGRAHLN